jgi:pimeloyl-ACP methyl ester carboxylesterase
MTPVTFDGCFGWFHPAKTARANDTAVLICPGLLKDAMLAHCSLRLLADRLAAAGYSTLRFDYPGTGDSCDENVSRDGGHWPAWRRSVHRAADWLRAQTGAQRLVLCGMRLGASLATLEAAERADVEALLLLEPITDGVSYLRQLVLEAELVNGEAADRSRGIELRELKLSPATLDDLQSIDLASVAPSPSLKVAIFARTANKTIAACAQSWAARGIDVAQPGWQGLEPLVRHNILEEDRLADFSAVLDWMKLAAPPRAGVDVSAVPAAELHPPGCVETAIQFGDDGRLAGVLCLPDTGSPTRTVIMCNAGRDPHYGAARVNVALARKLAPLGIGSFRIDFAGLGDSVGPRGREEILSPVFQIDRLADIQAAIDVLEKKDLPNVTVQGLCSGAYHAFQAALVDERIKELVLVNLPMFSLPRGDVLDFIEHQKISPLHYVQKLLRPGSWLTFLKGRSHVGKAMRGQWGSLRLHGERKLRALLQRAGLLKAESFPRQSMTDLGRRGVRTLFLFSPGEGELEAFEREFGANGAGLAGYRGAVMQAVSGMDHDLVRAGGRNDATGRIADFVRAAP